MNWADLRPCLALHILVLCAGCGSLDAPDSPDDAGSNVPRVVLGTGREAFEELAPDGVVPLIKGIQGGFHVWTSFLAYGFESAVLRMELTTRWEGLNESALEMTGNVSLKPALDVHGAAVLASLGWPASIFNPACSNGRRLAIELTVRDTAGGLSASDSRRWIVDVAPEDRATDCAK